MSVTQKEIRRDIVWGMLLSLLILLAGCTSETGDATGENLDNICLILTLRVAKTETTRATSADVEGSDAENLIDMAGGDYRICFFDYDPTTETGAGKGTNSTLIAVFNSDKVEITEHNNYTEYTVTGSVSAAPSDLTDFKVVMLANWGSYPTITEGVTTIDDLCEGTYSTFKAVSKFTIDATHLIPFYGIQEYEGVSLTGGGTTTLDNPVSMLPALAKVEVVFWNTVEQANYQGLTDVTLHRYNAAGYCAPANAYLSSDYNSETDEITGKPHLVNGKNDSDSGEKNVSFTNVQERVMETDGSFSQYETWVIYLPEYDNSTTDFSYITLSQEGSTGTAIIYFSEDAGGDAETATAPANCYDILRNYLYRFYVYRLSDEGIVQTRQVPDKGDATTAPIQVKSERIALLMMPPNSVTLLKPDKLPAW